MMIENIIFDFDGVILDSMPIRDKGFRAILKDHSDAIVDEFMVYHRANGGLSRFHKLRYFYEEMLKESVSDEEIYHLADEFSQMMRETLADPSYLIEETMLFLDAKADLYNLHIASGSEESELKYLCSRLGVRHYFLSIHGSPTHKNELVKSILEENGYDKSKTILIGDSMNDFYAAQTNGIAFYGYNNPELRKHAKVYLDHYGLL